MKDQQSPEATEHFADNRVHGDKSASTSRDVLFGRVAVHIGFIYQKELDEAIKQQASNPSVSLAEILMQNGEIDAEDRQLIKALVERHVAKHGNDPQQSLTFFPALSTDSQCPAGLDDTVAFVTKSGGSQLPQKRFGDYELLNEIARGGMGVVYQARQTKLNRLVALKMIRSGELADDEQVKRFYSEAEAAAKLDHPGIVPVYEVGEANGQHFFSMALVVGTSLNERVKNDGPLPPKEAARLLKSVVEAVEYAHGKGIIHRDIKPQNILLDEAGQPRLTDFGLAKQVKGQSDLTATGQVMGTPSYMPPEQARGKLAEIGPASDVYSLGATLYYLLIGRPPFQAASPLETVQQVLDSEPVALRRLNAAIPRNLETICLKCLRKETDKRYATAKDLATDLESWLENKPIVARPVGRAEKAWLWCKRRPMLVGMSLAFLVLSVAGGLVSWERLNAARAAGLVDALVSAETIQVPDVYAKLVPYHRWAKAGLNAHAPQSERTTIAGLSKKELHARLALLPGDSSHINVLTYHLLHAASVDELPVMAKFLSSYQHQIDSDLWQCVNENHGIMCLRAAAVLAIFDPENEAWRRASPDIVTALLSVPVTDAMAWINLLTRVGDRLAIPLEVRYRDRSASSDAERAIVAAALAKYLFVDRERLTDLILLADNEREFRPLLNSLLGNQSSVAAEFERLLRQAPPASDGVENSTSTVARDAFWKRQATAAICLLELRKAETFWPHLKHTENPSLRSFIIERLARLGADFNTLAERLETEQDPSIRQSLILALGDFDSGRLSSQDRQRVTEQLAELYRGDPDPGVHSAAAWTLRIWHEDALLVRADSKLQKSLPGGKQKERRWFTNSQGQAFVIVTGPVEFPVGGAFVGQSKKQKKIAYSFAISAHEVTVAQFQEFRKEQQRFTAGRSPEPECPALGVSWFDAVAYCNWLSEHERIPPEEWCYRQNDQGVFAEGTTIPADFSKRKGYRLPTDAEWEYVCRQNTESTYAFGESLELLPRYAWYRENSRSRTWPVGTLRPNALGVFDMSGGAWEWCHDSWQDVERPQGLPRSAAQTFEAVALASLDEMQQTKVQGKDQRVARGGSVDDLAAHCTSGIRNGYSPDDSTYTIGFRVARTYSSAP